MNLTADFQQRHTFFSVIRSSREMNLRDGLTDHLCVIELRALISVKHNTSLNTGAEPCVVGLGVLKVLCSYYLDLNVPINIGALLLRCRFPFSWRWRCCLARVLQAGLMLLAVR